MMTSKPTVAQLRQLVGNPNVYAVQKPDGQWFPVYSPITPGLLKKHLAEEITIGTYIVNGDTAKTLVFDIDSPQFALDIEKDWENDPKNFGFIIPASPAYNDGRAILKELKAFGVPEKSIAFEYSGKKGYHIWVLLGQYVPAEWLKRLGLTITTAAGVECEVFPKQTEAKKLGNLVKLPGGIHQVSKKQNEFLTPFPMPMAKSVLEQVMKQVPEEKTKSANYSGPLECMTHIQEGAGEGWRNHGLFHFAAHARRIGISGEPLLALLRSVNSNFNPPLDDDEVEQVFDSSENSGPICDHLPEEYRCTTCPLKQTSLYAKPGQLKHGTEGELAVIRVGKRRENGTIELVHPDLDVGLVRVR